MSLIDRMKAVLHPEPDPNKGMQGMAGYSMGDGDAFDNYDEGDSGEYEDQLYAVVVKAYFEIPESAYEESAQALQQMVHSFFFQHAQQSTLPPGVTYSGNTDSDIY